MPPQAHDALAARARQVLPGGVCSSTRLNRALGHPFYASRAAGSRVWDVDGREYLDFCCGHGAALLGHAHAGVTAALARSAELGHLCAFETEHQTSLAERLCRLIPCAERVRFTSSGTEATMHAIRLCRGATGRDRIIRVEGHFHGYHDILYIGGHPPADQLAGNQSHPFVESAGIPAAMADYVIPVPFNDPAAIAAALERHGDEVCAVILEPVNFNAGGLLPEPGYLAECRRLCDAAGALLFFDEVQTSFKASPGGAQQDFGVTPDLCTIGKSLGGGQPLSAICGRAELMDWFKPVGPVQHSGTFNAPLASILAASAFLDEVEQPDFYPRLQVVGDRFCAGLAGAAERHGVPLTISRHGARIGLAAGCQPPLRRYDDVVGHDVALMLAFLAAAYVRGVYFHDYGGQACHHGWSLAHSAADIDDALTRLDDALAAVARTA